MQYAERPNLVQRLPRHRHVFTSSWSSIAFHPPPPAPGPESSLHIHTRGYKACFCHVTMSKNPRKAERQCLSRRALAARNVLPQHCQRWIVPLELPNYGLANAKNWCRPASTDRGLLPIQGLRLSGEYATRNSRCR